MTERIIDVVHRAQAEWRAHVDLADDDSDTMADAMMRALARPDNRDALVAWLVEAGVLVRPIMVTPESDDHPVSDGRYVMPEAEAMSTWQDMADHDWKPLYRIGDDRA